MFAGLFLILSLVTVSAFSFSTSPSDLTIGNNKTTAVLSFPDPVNATVSLSSVSGLTTNLVSSFPLSNFSGSSTVNISLDSIASTVKFGTYAYTLSVFAQNSSNSAQNETKTASFNFIKSFCKLGAMGTNLSINGVDITNEGEGDESEWMTLDQITVDVEVRNEGDTDISDVNVEIALYDSSGNDVTGDLDFISTDEDQVDLGKINDGDKDTATFQFVVSSDLADDDYKLAVKAYSKKSGIGEEKVCADTSPDLDTSTYQAIKVSRQDDDGKRIGFDNIRFSPVEASCGDTIDVSFDAVNVGDEDQDQVKVSLSNKELGVNQSLELKGGLDQGDSESVSFTFEVPQGMADKTYTFDLFAQYDYNKGTYRQELDDAKKVSFKVFGCSPVSTTTSSGVLVTATSSEATAGQALTVTANIKNTGSSSASFVVDATGYNSWASKATLSERVLNLAAGESRDVTITLDVNSGVSGAQTFNVVTLAGQNTNSKTVSVNVAAAEGFSFGAGNTLLWVIGAINLVLVIVIIIVAVRVSRR